MKTAGLEFSLVSPQEYCDRLLALLSGAKERVVLAAMVVRAGPRTGEVLEAIAAAAERGVRVHILADIYGMHKVSQPDYLSKNGFEQELAQTRAIFGRITAQPHGGVSWVGRIGLNPYTGRYHAKVVVIDSTVFSFGGINFTADALQNIDYMLQAEDPVLAATLERLIADNGKGLPTTDLELLLDQQNTLLFDAGNRNISVIYNRACELAKQSSRITYVSQMCPTGPLARLIKATSHTCYFNQPTQTGFRPDTLAQLWDGWRSGIVNHYSGSTFLHAKCILYELRDGSRVSLSGSHNFSWRGVAFGTKEIALCSTSKEVWHGLQEIVYKVATHDRTG
jgi:cardiolipin synthase A/B